MRLSQNQINAFIKSITKFLNTNEKIELRLFGSRIDDTSKGGDIDLLIITENKGTSANLRQLKYSILANIFTQIEEEKIDLTIVCREDISSDSFIESIYPSSVLIHKW